MLCKNSLSLYALLCSPPGAGQEGYEPDKRSKYVPHCLDELGRVDQIQSLEVLLVSGISADHTVKYSTQ